MTSTTKNVNSETGEISTAAPASPGGSCAGHIGFEEGIYGTQVAIQALFDALAKAQSKIEKVAKDARNPHLKSAFASLGGIVDAIRPRGPVEGLALMQFPSGKDLVTVLTHKDGARVVTRMEMVIAKNDMQGLGAAIAYARRYVMKGIYAIAEDDDEGDDGSGGKTGSGDGKRTQLIEDPGHADVKAAFERIDKATDRAVLTGMASFAPSKYAGAALTQINDRITAQLSKAPVDLT